MTHSFKGIWIPIDLIELDISWTKRILIAEISQLEMLDKGCVASNSHFAHKLKLSKQAVSKALNELAKDGLIVINNAQTKRNFGRKITINFGVSAINFGVSGVHGSGESKENKQHNTTKSKYEQFIARLKAKAQTPSKVTITQQGKNFYKLIKDLDLFSSTYILHQKEKGEFASRVTIFMEDYISKQDNMVDPNDKSTWEKVEM